MSFKFLTRTDANFPIVLASEKCVKEANLDNLEELSNYVTGDEYSKINVPSDATKFFIRALSFKELNTIREDNKNSFPGLEESATKFFLKKEKNEEEYTSDVVLMLQRIKLKQVAYDLEIVKKGLVKIEGVDSPNPGDFFAPESEIGIYPLEDRYSALEELASHIKRASELGPLAAPHYNPLFG